MFTRNLTRHIARFVARYHYAVVAVAAILAVASFPRASFLFKNIDTDLVRLLPKHYKSVEQIDRIRQLFKTTKSVDLVVENPDPEKAKAFAIDLATYIESDPEVSKVIYKKPGYDFFDKHKLLFVDLGDLRTIRDRIDRRIQREKLGGLYLDFEDESSDKGEEFKFGDLDQKYRNKYSMGVRSEFYTNDAGTMYVIYVRPQREDGIKESKEFRTRIEGEVEKFAEARGDTETKVHFTGSIRTRVDEYDTLIRDLARAGIISGLGIFVILLLYFRRPMSVVLIFLPLTMGILMSFAFSTFFIKNLNLVTSFLFAILGGLGVEVGIHLLARYIEERRATLDAPDRDKAREDALFATLYHTGGSALTSAATVAATFFILIVNDFKGFSEFGFIAGFGLVINYIVFMCVFPSLLVLAEKAHLLGFRLGIGFDPPATRASRSLAREARRAGRSRFPLPRFILVGLAVAAILTIVNLPHVNFEWRFSKIKANIPEARLARAKHRETSKSVNNPAAVIVRNEAEADAIKKYIDEQKAANPKATVIDAFKSYYDLTPKDQEARLEVVHEMKDLLADKTLKLVKGEHKKDIDRFKEAMAETDLIEDDEIPQNVREIFKGTSEQEGMELAYINPLSKLELDDGRNAIRFAEQIEEIKTPIGTFYPSSDAIVFADVLRTMIRDGKRVVVLAFVIVFLIVWLDFRKFSAAALVVSPIVLGVLYMFGIMYVLDLRLNFYNIVVIPTAVGTSIDNSIHLYHRYKELGPGSIMAALKSSGSAALTSSLTNIFGFLGLVFTSHNGLKSIGDLAVAGLVGCLLTTLVYFPALLQVLEDRNAGSRNIRRAPNTPPSPC